MSRRVAREAALQVLYQIDIAKADVNAAIEFVIRENELNDKQVEFLRGLITGVLQNIEGLNRLINEISIDWNLDRMASVDRNILRLALYEICYSEDVPPSVAVNEAIELGKTYSTAESGRFINGILGKVLENVEKYRVIKSDIGV